MGVLEKAQAEFDKALAAYAVDLSAALDKRFGLALPHAHRGTPTHKTFNPDQPRDEHGRWGEGSGSPRAREWAQQGDKAGLTSTTPGTRVPVGQMTKEEYESLPVVYHGSPSEHEDKGFLFVTRSESGAASHGNVTSYRILPGAKVYADIEEDMKHTGQQTLLEGKASNSSGIVHMEDLTPNVPYAQIGLPAADRGTPTHKISKARLRYHDPVDHQAEEVATAEKAITKQVAAVFKKMAPKVAKQITKQLAGKLAKVDLDEEVTVDLSDFDILATGITAAQLKKVASAASKRTMAQVGPNAPSELVDQVNERAEAYAEERAAELVGMKWVDGELVENPRAEWAISDTTRDILNAIINDAMKEGTDVNDLAQEIEDSTAFSEERAMMIARTETIIANNAGAMVGYRAARDDLGLTVLKEWLNGEGACPICEANAAQGPIDLEEMFDSDDDAPPAHPNCRCAIAPVTVDDEGNQTVDEGDAEDSGE